jgi:hypothetical protein
METMPMKRRKVTTGARRPAIICHLLRTAATICNDIYFLLSRRRSVTFAFFFAFKPSLTWRAMVSALLSEQSSTMTRAISAAVSFSRSKRERLLALGSGPSFWLLAFTPPAAAAAIAARSSVVPAPTDRHLRRFRSRRRLCLFRGRVPRPRPARPHACQGAADIVRRP